MKIVELSSCQACGERKRRYLRFDERFGPTPEARVRWITGAPSGGQALGIVSVGSGEALVSESVGSAEIAEVSGESGPRQPGAIP